MDIFTEFTCSYCGKYFTAKNRLTQHEIRCSANPNRIPCEAWNKGKTKLTDSRVEQISQTLKGKDKGWVRYQLYLQDNSIAWGQQNMHSYKKYFLEDQQHKCAICGCEDTWNNQPLVFILDHINGNADDNTRTNLRLVCPNCDSQLDTFKSKNKCSARAKHRNIKIVTEEEYNLLNECKADNE